MGKVKLLLDVADGLRSLADSVAAVADAMQQSVAQEPEVVAEPAITLEQVRAVLADKSRAGKTEAVRELLGQFGVDRLSAIESAQFPELLAAAEEL